MVELVETKLIRDRDQELRFTVHESPDYYKLKCSIFNDDKKTELIGESWIDLKGVLISGGGQNDLWHQLRFKGKYAGEIRIELTYYDTRPKDEPTSEKRRGGEKNSSRTSSSPAAVGGPRHLGPREVKRRPLPMNPGDSSPATRPKMPDHVHSLPVSGLTHSEQFESDHYRAPDHNHYPAVHNQQSDPALSFATGSKQQWPPEHGYDQPSRSDWPPPPHAYQTSSNDGYIDHSGTQQSYCHSSNSVQSEFHSSPPPMVSYRDLDQERRHSAQPSFPTQRKLPSGNSAIGTLTTTSQPQQESSRSALESGDYQHQVYGNQYSTSPAKADTYRDSPLRQSISHHEVESDYDLELEDSYHHEPSPPPPPAHRNINLSTPVTTSNQGMPACQIPRKPPTSALNNFTPDSRSPLQTIERKYDPRYNFDNATHSAPHMRQDTYHGHAKVIRSPLDPGARQSSVPRPVSGRENLPPEMRISQELCMAGLEEPEFYQDERPRRLSEGIIHMPEQRPFLVNRNRQQFYEHAVPHEARRNTYTETPITRPCPTSPSVPGSQGTFALQSPVAPRQSVSPQPCSAQSQVEQDDRRLKGVPFGPDSYDVLNPASSPTSVNGPSVRYETPEQAKELARQQGVEKLRDQGPIIGNDGRVIDPSDHLPTDTWAPEPERKVRKPEHVIRFKTRDEILRTPNKHGSSPDSMRSQTIGTPLYGSSPISMETPSSSPAQARIGRNKLQKQMPSRPLPMQPFQHPHSSPAVPKVSQPPDTHQIPSPRAQMRQRPALSDYPVTPQQGPGTGQYDAASRTGPPLPEKVPLYSRDSPQRPSGYGIDALSAELSTIDIGGRDGRSGGRWRGGY